MDYRITDVLRGPDRDESAYAERSIRLHSRMALLAFNDEARNDSWRVTERRGSLALESSSWRLSRESTKEASAHSHRRPHRAALAPSWIREEAGAALSGAHHGWKEKGRRPFRTGALIARL